ncbi:hypothetical protein CBR_g46010 [Chara braunii]|uniref:Uncharacterized protein n=1 Tax=Chara braunii TaxID=69332 RepID=A0A388LZV5_CHABU|nr:hypothetical protein CBR_g46010 [Chara braunii]|eukprot:GBG87854.1 hypothetical protein CBR_g46010 [Chara braunii]
MENLKKRNEETEEVVQLWRNDALRLGNKRGSINVRTTEGRTSTRSRLMGTPEETRRLRAELLDIHERRKCDLTELDLLKQKKTDAEVKCVEAELELARLREQMGKLSTEQAGCSTPREADTHLKEKMDEAARSGFRSERKGRVKMTYGRVPRPNGIAKKENDKFLLLQDERKRLKGLKKSGLEELCREEGLQYRTTDATSEELAQLYMTRMFGDEGARQQETGSERSRGKEAAIDASTTVVEEVPPDSA